MKGSVREFDHKSEVLISEQARYQDGTGYRVNSESRATRARETAIERAVVDETDKLAMLGQVSEERLHESFGEAQEQATKHHVAIKDRIDANQIVLDRLQAMADGQLDEQLGRQTDAKQRTKHLQRV